MFGVNNLTYSLADLQYLLPTAVSSGLLEKGLGGTSVESGGEGVSHPL